MWQKKLEEHINKTIEECFKKITDFADKEKEYIKEKMLELSEVQDANNTEPTIKYNNKFITPREHLQDLIDQLHGDIFPLLKVPEVTAGGAPFTVLRNIFCYMEYVALLRFGKKRNSESGNLEKMLDDFGPEDMKARYRIYKKYLIQLYRHDLVHLTSPRMKIIQIKNDRNRIAYAGFFIISDVVGQNNVQKKSKILGDFDQACSLMRSVNFRKNSFIHLRLSESTITINTLVMFFDLINYLKDYQASLAKEEELNRNFAENLIEANLNSAIKLIKEQPIDLSKNKQINYG
jgi:hypothetical protein